MAIQATLYRTWPMRDGTSKQAPDIDVPPGTHELERIPNPHGHKGNWLVLKGTKTGMAEGAWRQWIVEDANAKEDDPFRIILIEDDVVIPPLRK